MRIKNYLVFALVCFAVLGMVLQADAGNKNKLGTAGAQELLIPVGARGTAMGGAYAAGINGVDAIFWNPAGLANSQHGVEALVSYMNYIADINLGYAAVGVKSGIGSFGFSIKSLSIGDIPVTTENAPDGTGATFTPNFMTIGLTYSRAMTDRIYVGANLNVVSEQISRATASAFAVDLGVQYLTDFGVKLGVAMKNFGPSMRFSGTELEREVYLPATDPNAPPRRLALPSVKMELPSQFEIGLSYEMKPMENANLIVAGNFVNQNFGHDQICGGAEFAFMDMFFLRGSYLFQADIKTEDNLWGPAFGFGLKYDLGGTTGVAFDYTYRTAQYFSGNNIFSLKFVF